jgi:trans-aconitate methyltransferase
MSTNGSLATPGRPDKDFGPIRDDYAFFEAHSTQAASDLDAYLPIAQAVMGAKAVLRMLDFGCGSGKFTAKLLRRLACPEQRLLLSLVEPQPLYREQACRDLASFTTSPISAAEALPGQMDGEVDMIVANHVFYYVPDLDGLLPRLVRAVGPGGVLMAAVSGHDNHLIAFWRRCFGLLGVPVPYNTAETVAAVLARHGVDAVREKLRYELSFEDTRENRATILRFLLAGHYGSLPEAEILRLFDPFARAGRIVMDMQNDHFIVRGG